ALDAPGSPPMARVPEHARSFLNRLLVPARPYREVRAFQKELRATQDRPTEVSRGRRAGQLATWVGLSCLCPCWCLIPGALMPMFTSGSVVTNAFMQERALEALRRDADRDLAAGLLSPSPLVRLQAVQQWQEDQRLAVELEAAREANRQLLDQRLAS